MYDLSNSNYMYNLLHHIRYTACNPFSSLITPMLSPTGLKAYSSGTAGSVPGSSAGWASAPSKIAT